MKTDPLVQCTLCSTRLNPRNVQKHLDKVHGTKPAKPPATPPIDPDRPYRCSCGALTTFSTHLAHQAACHTPEVSPVRHRSIAPGPGNPRRSSLDGSDGYHESFREANRFGSHPSHDDYSDESFS